MPLISLFPILCKKQVKQFPGKLHDLITYAELNGLDHIISWVYEGRAFMVHNQELLLQILPIFFGQTKFRSFQRQLNVGTQFHSINPCILFVIPKLL